MRCLWQSGVAVLADIEIALPIAEYFLVCHRVHCDSAKIAGHCVLSFPYNQHVSPRTPVVTAGRRPALETVFGLAFWALARVAFLLAVEAARLDWLEHQVMAPTALILIPEIELLPQWLGNGGAILAVMAKLELRAESGFARGAGAVKCGLFGGDECALEGQSAKEAVPCDSKPFKAALTIKFLAGALTHYEFIVRLEAEIAVVLRRVKVEVGSKHEANKILANIVRYH